MVTPTELLPLAFGIVCVVLPLVARMSAGVRASLSRFALALFGSFINEDSSRAKRRKADVRSARLKTVYRVYAARTLLYTTLVAVGGAFIGVYVLILIERLLALPIPVIQQLEFVDISQLTTITIFALFLLSSVTFGLLSAILAYLYRIFNPRRIANQREQRIEESLPRTVAFMFALSRSGMSQTQLVRIVATNSKYFGEAAEEFVISLRDIETSGRDFLTATRDLAVNTPSEEFSNFAEDLANVLRTGRSMSEYFREEYNQYQADKRSRQEQALEDMAALAEGYVALLVAGPLFLVTILVVIGLLVGGTLDPLRVFIYGVLPLLNIAFLAYLDSTAINLGSNVDIDDYGIVRRGATGDGAEDTSQAESVASPTTTASDGGYARRERANRQRLQWYTRIRGLLHSVKFPVRTIARSTNILLYIAVPIGITYVLARSYIAMTQGDFGVRTIDDYLIHATLFVIGMFSIGEYVRSRRKRRIERGVPDFVDRLADQAEAGMTLTRAISGMNAESIPSLEAQIKRLQADLQLGSRTSEALRRMAVEAKSVLVSRVVILTTNALRASGDVAPVLRIAADEAQLNRRLARRRRQELLVYQAIIYVSMLVFIGITVVLIIIFIPSLPSGASFSAPDTAGAPGVSGIGIGGISGSTEREAYKLVLFHGAAIQSLMSGVVAGKMGEGRVRAGMKHATALLAAVYGIMVLI